MDILELTVARTDRLRIVRILVDQELKKTLHQRREVELWKRQKNKTFKATEYQLGLAQMRKDLKLLVNHRIEEKNLKDDKIADAEI